MTSATISIKDTRSVQIRLEMQELDTAWKSGYIDFDTYLHDTVMLNRELKSL